MLDEAVVGPPLREQLAVPTLLDDPRVLDHHDAVGITHRRQDFWHLVEKLAEAAPLLNEDASRPLAGLRLRLLNESSAAREILYELTASGRSRR